MLILNASPVPVKAQYGGGFYFFNASERKEIFDPYAAHHILNRWGKYGLVDVTFTDKVADKYQDHEIFIHEQRKLGLQNVLATLFEQNQHYMGYEQECGDKQTTERLQFKQKQKKVLAQIKAVEQVIMDVENFDTQNLLTAKAAKLEAQAAKLKKEAEKLRGGKKKVEDGNKSGESAG